MASGGMDTDVSDAVSRQELDKLQQDLALAATSFNEMKSKIAGLETQLQQATLREQTKSTAHANKPEPFRGHGTTTSLGSWIFSLNTYLEATNADPTRWVVLASTYLTESAAVWYEHRVHDLHAAGILDTWDAFCQDLINTFQPISAHAMARDSLHKLHQTNTVQQFNSEFLKTITLVRNMTEDEKVDKYTYGLKPHLKREVLMENCTTLSHAMQVASKSEMVFARTHREMPNAIYNRPYRPYNNYNNYHPYPAHTGYQDTAVPMEVNYLSNGYYDNYYNGHRDYGTYQGQQYTIDKRPYSTGSGNAPRRDTNQNNARHNTNANSKSNNNSGQWRPKNVNVSAMDVSTSLPEPCGSPSMTPCFTENSENFICNKIQEEECQIFEAFVSLFNETNDSKLDTTTPSDDPSTIAPWTTRVMFGKYGFTALLDTGATADIMRPDIADYMNLERYQCASSRTLTLADKTTHKCDEYVIADFNLYQVDGNAKPRKFFIADMPNSSHAIILGMPFINDFQLTPIWQPNVSPSLRVNINGITSTIWTSQTADNKNTTTDNIYMNMLITTEDLSESDQVPPNQFDNLCKHADDLLDTVSSEMPRPPPPTPASELPLRPLLPEPNTRTLKRPLDDDVSSQE